MDIVTKNLLKTFHSEESLPADIAEEVLFEHFANFCVLAKEYSEEFSLDDIHTGEGGDMGIDGIAILANGNLIANAEEIADLAKTNKYIEAEFIFIQAKSTSKFDGADISNFLFGARDVFNTNSRMPKNKKVTEKIGLINSIYEHSSRFKNGKNPNLKLYYVSTGKWHDDRYILAKVDSDLDLLRDTSNFHDVTFTPVDASGIQKLYNYAKNSVSKIIEFENKITIPEIKGIKESYLGILPVSELIKLITDEDGILLRSLFYDNLRDFQGENEVNLEIQDTIQSEDKDLFVLLNNGITIVADDISNKTRNKFSIEGFQIVNGCQTSNVLYNNREFVINEMHVPVRIIVPEDDEIKNKIIKATNRQTPVKNEELVALTDFQKLLEKYYAAQSEPYKLYYERRSQQYRSSSIEKIRIVTISSQIRSFSSMFLNEPNLAGRYYGTLLSSVKDKIFCKDHKPIAYYVSAYANYKLDALIRKKQIDEKYRSFKYIILMLLRIKLGGKEIPNMASNQFEKYCKTIQDTLWDNAKIIESLDEVRILLDKVLDGDYDRDRAKTARFVKELTDSI